MSRTYDPISPQRVAFIGLGVMGFPMAGHLARAGHQVCVYNRTAAKAERWKDEYGHASAPTPADAARDADLVFACVGNDDDLRAVTTGPDGAFGAMKPGAVFVDHTGERSMVSGHGADFYLLPQELPRQVLREARHLHLTAWSFFVDPPRAAARAAARDARDAGATISFDPGSFQMIGEMGVPQFLSVTRDLGIDIFLPNKEEGSMLTGGLTDPHEIAAALAELYPGALIMLKLDAAGALVCADNTFLSPAWQQPLALGCDIVIHSTTKYLNGHSDSVGGAVIATRDEHIQWLRFVQNAEGAILSPMDSWLVLRGTKTLPVRMARHNENALALARFLASHAAVARVHYPGLPDHPQHALATRQMRGFGGLISFELGSLERARALLNGVRLMALAESLGGVESLISHPATMTHASVPEDRRRALGITDGLVRLSVGVEDQNDLEDDLGQALERVTG